MWACPADPGDLLGAGLQNSGKVSARGHWLWVEEAASEPISSGTGLSNWLVLEEVNSPSPTGRPFSNACKLGLCGRWLSGESPVPYSGGGSFTVSLHWLH